MENPPVKLAVEETIFPLAEKFTISRGSRTKAQVVTVKLSQDRHIGWGEGVPYARYGESADSVIGAIRAMAGSLEAGLSRAQLQEQMAPGAARNALDCALWDLECKRLGKRAWQLAGLDQPGPVTSAYTLSLGEPSAMREKAKANSWRPLLKIKLGGAGDLQRLEAVRAGAPETGIIVDANEGWTVADYQALAPELLRLGVKMVEQPLPAGADQALAEIERRLPVCADESCHDRASLPGLEGRYDVVNIKLDKTGGLTEALALREAAIKRGFAIMVGCMIGSSLAMAPAVLVAQGAAYVDLDGPLLLAKDRERPLSYDGSLLSPPQADLWG